MSTHAHALHIAIVHAEPLLRQAIAHLFTAQPNCTVLVQAADAPALKRAAATGLVPGLVLLCMDMACAMDRSLLRWAAANLPLARLLLLGRQAAPEELAAALCAGAHGYHCTRNGQEHLLHVAGLVMQGALHFPPETHRALHQWHQRTLAPPTPAGPLPSIAHSEFLYWAAHPDELTYADIARRMGRSTRAVEKYRATLFKRHNIKSRTGLVHLAMALRLVG